MLSVIIAWVLLFVAWALAINASRKNQEKKAPVIEEEGEGPKLYADIAGDAYKISERSVALTDPMVNKKDQYGYAMMSSSLKDKFELQFEMMLDDNLFDNPVAHGMVWISLSGNPLLERASISTPLNDGGVRLYISQFKSKQLSSFSMGMMHASSTDVRRTNANLLPVSLWIPCSIVYSSNLVKFKVGQYMESFVPPQQWNYDGNAYLAAKTTSNSGIRVRNLKFDDGHVVMFA